MYGKYHKQMPCAHEASISALSQLSNTKSLPCFGGLVYSDEGLAYNIGASVWDYGVIGTP